MNNENQNSIEMINKMFNDYSNLKNIDLINSDKFKYNFNNMSSDENSKNNLIKYKSQNNGTNNKLGFKNLGYNNCLQRGYITIFTSGHIACNSFMLSILFIEFSIQMMVKWFWWRKESIMLNCACAPPVFKGHGSTSVIIVIFITYYASNDMFINKNVMQFLDTCIQGEHFSVCCIYIFGGYLVW